MYKAIHVNPYNRSMLVSSVPTSTLGLGHPLSYLTVRVVVDSVLGDNFVVLVDVHDRVHTFSSLAEAVAEIRTRVLRTPTGRTQQDYVPPLHKLPVAGHHSVHTGIQNHSLGELYPCIIVGFGDGLWGVQLGSEVIKTKTQEEAVAIAKEVKGELDRDYRLGVIRFTRMKVYGGVQ